MFLSAAARKVAPIALDARTLGIVNRSRDRVGAALGAIARDVIELLDPAGVARLGALGRGVTATP